MAPQSPRRRAPAARSPQRTAREVAPARRCAYLVIRRVFERGAYADRALQSQSRELDARDRALAMRLAYGSVQRRATLDHLISALAGRPAARLDGPLLAALRLGLYELCYLDGAPAYATVGDAVELARGDAPAGAGLVNAVLRRAAREGAATLLEGLQDTTPQQAALKHSHPEWVAELWFQTLGPEDARALMAFDNEPGEVALRVNTLLADTDVDTLARELPVRSHRDPEIPEALVLEQALDLHSSPLWRAGALMAQSRAAMLVSRTLEPQPGERVLDLCAAPGGKSTHIAALMEGRGEVIAVERDRRRAGELARSAQRMRAANIRVEVGDAAAQRTDQPSTACSWIRPAAGSECCRHALTCAGVSASAACRRCPGHRARSCPQERPPSVREACLSTLRAPSPRLRTSV